MAAAASKTSLIADTDLDGIAAALLRNNNFVSKLVSRLSKTQADQLIDKLFANTYFAKRLHQFDQSDWPKPLAIPSPVLAAGNGIALNVNASTDTQTISCNLAGGNGITISGTTQLTVTAAVASIVAGTGVTTSNSSGAITVNVPLTAGTGVTLSGGTAGTGWTVNVPLAAGTGVTLGGGTAGTAWTVNCALTAGSGVVLTGGTNGTAWTVSVPLTAGAGVTLAGGIAGTGWTVNVPLTAGTGITLSGGTAGVGWKVNAALTAGTGVTLGGGGAGAAWVVNSALTAGNGVTLSGGTAGVAWTVNAPLGAGNNISLSGGTAGVGYTIATSYPVTIQTIESFTTYNFTSSWSRLMFGSTNSSQTITGNLQASGGLTMNVIQIAPSYFVLTWLAITLGPTNGNYESQTWYAVSASGFISSSATPAVTVTIPCKWLGWTYAYLSNDGTTGNGSVEGPGAYVEGVIEIHNDGSILIATSSPFFGWIPPGTSGSGTVAPSIVLAAGSGVFCTSNFV